MKDLATHTAAGEVRFCQAYPLAGRRCQAKARQYAPELIKGERMVLCGIHYNEARRKGDRIIALWRERSP